MKTCGRWSAATTLGCIALMLTGCGLPDPGPQSSVPRRPVQYASLEPHGGYAADYSPPAARATAPIPPVRSLLEMRHHDVVIQKWDLSCGAAALATLLRYEFGDPVTEKQIALSLMSRGVYVKNPKLVQIREGFSLFDLKRYLKGHGYKGEGLGQLDFDDLVQRAPLMVPINALGYNHFVIFRGVMGNTVLLADPAWGNRTMTVVKFKRLWLDYGKAMGHVGFVVIRADGGKPLTKLTPKPSDFVMLDLSNGTPAAQPVAAPAPQPSPATTTAAGGQPQLAARAQPPNRTPAQAAQPIATPAPQPNPAPAIATGQLPQLATLAGQLDRAAAPATSRRRQLAAPTLRPHHRSARAAGGLHKLAVLARQLLIPWGREKAHESLKFASRAE